MGFHRVDQEDGSSCLTGDGFEKLKMGHFVHFSSHHDEGLGSGIDIMHGSTSHNNLVLQ